MKRTLLATAILMTFIASAQAEEFNYSNQNFDQGISVIGDGNKLVADNLNITGSKFFDTPGRNEGIYIAKGASAEFGGDSLNIQFSNQDSSKEFVGIQINAVPSTKTSAIFASKNTVIDVSGPVDSDKWGFGLLVNGFGESSALFSGENVFIKTTTENYTSQSVTVKSGSSIDFSNTENVQIEAYSDYGVTVVDSVRVESDERSGRILFNNEGNVTLIGSVLGNETAQTNVIGMQGWDSLWTVTDKVNEFRISLNGAGVDAVEGVTIRQELRELMQQDKKCR